MESLFTPSLSNLSLSYISPSNPSTHIHDISSLSPHLFLASLSPHPLLFIHLISCHSRHRSPLNKSSLSPHLLFLNPSLSYLSLIYLMSALPSCIFPQDFPLLSPLTPWPLIPFLIPIVWSLFPGPLTDPLSPKGRECNPPPCSRHLGQVV
jgi:hypothetical protein